MKFVDLEQKTPIEVNNYFMKVDKLAQEIFGARYHQLWDDEEKQNYLWSQL